MWVKYGNGNVMQDKWAFKDRPAGSTEAELMAIANAVHVVCSKIDVIGKIIVVVTDSQGAIDYLKHKHGKIRKLHQIAQIIRKTVKGKCKIVLKKVKAHSSNDGCRSYVNGIVDKSSREAMKISRARHEFNSMGYIVDDFR